MASACPGKGCGHHNAFASSRVTQHPWTSPWLTHERSGRHPLSHVLMVGTEAFSRCRRPAGAGWLGSWWWLPPWWNNSDNHGWLVIRSEAQKSCVGWFQRLRVAEKMALIATRKEVGGWPEAGKKGVPGSVPSKHCWKQEVDQWDYCTYILVTLLIEHSFF